MLLPDILTPTLLLDEAVCRRNISRMCEKAAAHGLRFRPHFKTHQSRRIASWLRDEGVSAITVSSVGMARYFADDGWNDITIAFPVNLREAAEINALAERIDLGVLIESSTVASRLQRELHSPVDVWIKIDTGYGRSGVVYDDGDRLAEIARCLDSSATLRLRGILTHGGDTYQALGPTDVQQRFSLSKERMLIAADALRSRHSEILISVGDTPACTVAQDFTGIDEIRPGNFVFFDVMQLHRGICRVEDIAVALACPVVALHDMRNELVLYGGAVHLSREYIADARGTQLFGLVAPIEGQAWGPPIAGAYVTRMSQEHGIVRIPAEQRFSLTEGDLLAILPVHSCLTAECMKQYRCLDGTTADHFAGAFPRIAEFSPQNSSEDH
jgi:D-serine deaminase-like pyridoxal phosphate-dependent protein